MQSLTSGMELLGATPIEKNPAVRKSPKLKKSVGEKAENVLGTGCQRTSFKSLGMNTLRQLEMSGSAITLQCSRINQTQGGTARLG